MKHLLPILTLCLAGLFPLNVSAASEAYDLQQDKSSVRFTYTLNGQPAKGSMPVNSADLQLDFDRLSRSTVRVVLNASRARTGLIFATEAMRGRSVLNVANHPMILFQSTRIIPTAAGATIEGKVTLRGVTRPMQLQARLFRQKGRPKDDLSLLTILLTGFVNRSEFGASGFSDIVGNRIDLRILARIKAVK